MKYFFLICEYLHPFFFQKLTSFREENPLQYKYYIFHCRHLKIKMGKYNRLKHNFSCPEQHTQFKHKTCHRHMEIYDSVNEFKIYVHL